MPSPAQAIAALMQQHLGCKVLPDSMQLIATGASGRSIMRSSSPCAQGILGIYWTANRADNASFVPAAKGLAAAGVQVPQLLAEIDLGQGCGACLVQDLGTQDLLSLKDAPWPIRKTAYAKALRALIPLHNLRPDWPLQPAFNADMYRWEQEYFAEHLLTRHLGYPADLLKNEPAMQRMADELASLPGVPIHRDFQSQNIMLQGGLAYLIDFQGMRLGLAEYDIASLIYDPYMNLSEEESNELFGLYAEMKGAAPDEHIFCACAMQRLMQALGAYANIGYNQHKEWYLSLIPTGLSKLRQIAARVPVGSPVADVARWLESVI